MATKTSAQIKQELDDLLYEDTVDAAPWDLTVKRRALNRAIRGSYPHFKVPTFDATNVTLASSTYAYTLTTGFTLMEDLGGYAVSQVYLQPLVTSLDWVPLRRVTQDYNGANWRLHVPENIADGNAGRLLRVHFVQRVAELLFTGVAADVLDTRFVNHVVYKAAYDLISRFLQGGSDYNTDLYLPLWKEYKDIAAQELHNNVVYMLSWIGVRTEGQTRRSLTSG